MGGLSLLSSSSLEGYSSGERRRSKKRMVIPERRSWKAWRCKYRHEHDAEGAWWCETRDETERSEDISADQWGEYCW